MPNDIRVFAGDSERISRIASPFSGMDAIASSADVHLLDGVRI
jgi:hypothetical protein